MIRILYVEDDENDRYFVKHALGRGEPEAELETLGDGARAIEFLEGRGAYADRGTHPLPDLVLMDLKLPRKTGHEVLEWMRGRPEFRDLPVVVLSSSMEKRDVERAYAAGASAYLAKQPDLVELSVILRGVVELARTKKVGREGFEPPTLCV